MIARLTRSMDSLTAVWARPTMMVFARPRLATSTSISQGWASMPRRMKEWILASTRAAPSDLPRSAYQQLEFRFKFAGITRTDTMKDESMRRLALRTLVGLMLLFAAMAAGGWIASLVGRAPQPDWPLPLGGGIRVWFGVDRTSLSFTISRQIDLQLSFEEYALLGSPAPLHSHALGFEYLQMDYATYGQTPRGAGVMSV